MSILVSRCDIEDKRVRIDCCKDSIEGRLPLSSSIINKSKVSLSRISWPIFIISIGKVTEYIVPFAHFIDNLIFCKDACKKKVKPIFNTIILINPYKA